MCGRFSLATPDFSELVDELEAAVAPEDRQLFKPRWNIAPTDLSWILEEGRALVPARWGFAAGKKQLINARLETAATVPMFRDAFANRRAVVPADSFYEWSGEGANRKPFQIRPREGGLLLLAGMWSPKSANEDAPRFVVLTQPAEKPISDLHDRMPVILIKQGIDQWLAGGDAISIDPKVRLDIRPISARINSVANDDASCWDPPAPASQGSLFQ